VTCRSETFSAAACTSEHHQAKSRDRASKRGTDRVPDLEAHSAANSTWAEIERRPSEGGGAGCGGGGLRLAAGDGRGGGGEGWVGGGCGTGGGGDRTSGEGGGGLRGGGGDGLTRGEGGGGGGVRGPTTARGGGGDGFAARWLNHAAGTTTAAFMLAALATVGGAPTGVVGGPAFSTRPVSPPTWL